jgi:hypothetical protein
MTTKPDISKCPAMDSAVIRAMGSLLGLNWRLLRAIPAPAHGERIMPKIALTPADARANGTATVAEALMLAEAALVTGYLEPPTEQPVVACGSRAPEADWAA